MEIGVKIGGFGEGFLSYLLDLEEGGIEREVGSFFLVFLFEFFYARGWVWEIELFRVRREIEGF